MGKLEEATKLKAEGKTNADVARELKISEETLHRWYKTYGQMDRAQARELKALRDENERFACTVVGVSRSAFYRGQQHTKDVATFDKCADLRTWFQRWATTNPRWGYRRAWVKAKEEGFIIGRDALRRLWRQEGLRVMPRRRSKQKILMILPQGLSQ